VEEEIDMETTAQPAASHASSRYSKVAELILRDRPDAQTHAHGTAWVSVRAALALGFTEFAAGRVGLAATLHDVGKQLIGETILEKPGPLTDTEWTQIRLHPILGEQMLIGEGLLDIAPWVRSHHERFDGLGYPDGLFGEEIPLESRILACSDAYDAMITERPYQAAVSPARAREELALAAGAQFDPKVLAIVLRCTHNEWLGTDAAQLATVG
jgi:HD-GYP domain-containing protein (c-di-GMP phosphodiesterase class II)